MYSGFQTDMLDELIYAQPGHLIRRAHQLAWSAFMEETKGLEITSVQYAALVAIADNPGVDATRLSQLISFDRATIGNVLDRLEQKGLLNRKPHETDKRAKQTFLTAKGKHAIKVVAQLVPHVAERILHRLAAKERRQLMLLLARLVGMERGQGRTATQRMAHSRGLDRPRQSTGPRG